MSFIPQMSPMKWSFIMMMMFINLFNFMIYMNSFPQSLMISNKINVSKMKWTWIW